MIYDRTDELRWDLVDVAAKHGFVLCSVKWNPDKKTKGVKWNSLGVGLDIYIHGFPLDHPIKEIIELVDSSLDSSLKTVKNHGPTLRWFSTSGKKGRIA